jgi:opacity protein-like surface antigen
MICKKRPRKRYLLLTFVTVMMVGLLISYSYGEEDSKTRYGFSIMGGAGEAWRTKPDMTVFGFLPRVDLPLHRNWDLEIEGNFSYWAISREKNLYFSGVNANIVFKPIHRNWGSLFLLAGGGMGYDSGGGKVKEIGNQHIGGILQTGAGIYYNLRKGLALRAEYRFYHISEPFTADSGLNTHCALLGISF